MRARGDGGDELGGQREMVMTRFTPKGTLIPWPGSLRIEGEEPLPLLPGSLALASKGRVDDDGNSALLLRPYEMQFKWQGLTLVSTPDLRAPASMANDYCGPDRSKERKAAMA